MPSPTITPTTINRSGVDLTTVTQAAAATDTWANTGKEMFWVNNGSAASVTVTLTLSASATVDGQSASNRTVAVANGHAKLIGPFPTNLYNDANGFVEITYSANTSVTVAVIIPTTN